MIKPKVLFLCGANSCRTQMAEGFLRDLAGDRFEVMSAGYEPSREICRDAVEVMREVGIDISGQRPKKTGDFLGQRIGYVVTLCDREKERSCPIFAGALWRLIWPLEDPLLADSPDERLAAVRRARDEIRRRVVEFVSEHA
ncbi:MAG TPA: arsenate reductase ArsC [Terriglobales bacterium]|nr:arsenate reductase ArsC [Terriglobales bacterium]